MRKCLIILLVLFININVFALGYGDINNDGKISSADYITIRKYIMKNGDLTGDQIKSADINKDKTINSQDYIMIRKKIISGETKPEIIDAPVSVTNLNLISNPKLVLKVGQSETINISISPSNAKIKYDNSNTNALKVDQNGKIEAISPGTGTITIKSEDESKQVNITYTINPKTGVINGDGGIWQYSSSTDQIPTRANVEFFKNLASKGKGSISGDVYTYTDNKHTYKYEINKSVLTVDGNESLTRIYYPKDKDLSMANTFTTFAGTGPNVINFGEFLGHLDKHPEDMKSSGIIILVSTNIGSRYDPDDAINSTEFVRSIVNQKNGVKNTMGGYSGSGQYAGTAANNGPYDRLIICNTSFNADKTTNLFNKEIIIFSPTGDFMVDHTTTGLNYMRMKGYTNVTVITNNSSLLKNKSYYSNFLMINPGSQMGNGHGYSNIINAHLFSYACR